MTPTTTACLQQCQFCVSASQIGLQIDMLAVSDVSGISEAEDCCAKAVAPVSYEQSHGQ